MMEHVMVILIAIGILQIHGVGKRVHVILIAPNVMMEENVILLVMDVLGQEILV